ncbi:hypothetical protein GCM10009853_016290 [Glycomyces scopariae]
MDRDPDIALVALAVILVAGAIAAVVGGLRSDRRRSRIAGSTGAFSAAQVRGGEWSLVLDRTGDRQIQVIKEIRTITGLGLAEAKRLTDRAPSIVLDRVDHASASAAYQVLATAGATVRITEVGPPEPPAPGLCAVVLHDAGPKKIQVIKEIRMLTGLGLAEAKQLTDRMPSTVLADVDSETGAAAQARLTAAGATVRVTGS